MNITNYFSAEQIHIDQTLKDIDQLFREHQMTGDTILVQNDADQHIVVDQNRQIEPEDTVTRPSLEIFKKFIDSDRKAADIPLPVPSPATGPLLLPAGGKKRGRKAADGKGPPKKRGRKAKTNDEKMTDLISSVPCSSSTAAESSNVPAANGQAPGDESSLVAKKPKKKAPGKKRGRKKKTTKKRQD